MGVGLWKWPYCPTILNTVAEMDITIAPNCISCMWLQSDHMCSTPKSEDKEHEFIHISWR